MPKKYTILMLAALALASCADPIASSVVSSVDDEVSSSTLPSSEVVSSEAPSRLLVSEMMEDLELGNFTYTMTYGNVDLYEYRVDIPFMHMTFVDPETNEQSSLFLDLTNEEAPVLYIEQDDDSWLVTPADPFVLMSILFPLQLIDPSGMENDWFTWSDAEEAYILLEAYYDDVFGEDMEGTEYFQIAQLPNGDIQIMLQGRESMNDPLDTILLTYANIGTTEVTLPDVVIDFPTFMMNDLLPNSTNHRFSFSISPIDEFGETGQPVQSVFGERLNETFSSTRIDNETMVTHYVTQNNDGPLHITLDDLGYAETPISQTEYDQLLADFYPVPILELQPESLDLTQPLVLESEGIVAYPLLDTSVDAFVANILPDGALHVATMVIFLNSSWMGPFVATETTFVFENTEYQALMSLGNFDDVDIIYPPYDPGETVSLAEVLNQVQLVQNYQLFQAERDADFATIAMQTVERDGDLFAFHDFEQSPYPEYYQTGDATVSQWAYDEDLHDYVMNTLSNADFETVLDARMWLNPEVLTMESLVEDPQFPNSYTIEPSLYASLISDTIEARMTIDSITLYVSSFGEPTLYFTVYGQDITSNLPMTLDITLSDIGSTEIILPGDQTSSFDYVDLSTFNSFHSLGVHSFLGTMERYDATNARVDEAYFGRQGSLLAFVDPNLGSFDVYNENDTQTGYERIQGTLGSSQTQTTSIDAAVYDERFAAINVLQFDALQPNNLQFFNESNPVDGDYRLDALTASAFISQFIDESETIQDVRLQLSLETVTVTVSVQDAVTNESATLRITYEAINENTDILSLLTN